MKIKAYIDPGRCCPCHNCVNVCKKGAIFSAGYCFDVDEKLCDGCKDCEFVCDVCDAIHFYDEDEIH